MNKIYTETEGIILPKEISFVPYSNEVDYRTFSAALDDNKMSATYKMYWLLALLEEIQLDNFDIDFKKLISRMVTFAWYPILKYKLNFGLCDNLVKVVNYIEDTYCLGSNYDEKKLLDFIYNYEDKILNKMLRDLTYNVPYRFLSPFFREHTRKERSKVEKIIEELSRTDENCVYEIYIDENKKKRIRIRENWCNYLKNNYRILQGWAYYKLVFFLQKRNLNVPGIAMKLEAPKKRNLTAQTKIWKEIIETNHINDIYTGLEFTKENYNEYGVLSMDHFIPWSFVLHDEIWNLVPTFKNINSKKSDNLLNYDKYIDKFCDLQYKAFSFVVDKKRNNQIEEYRELLRIENAKKFKAERTSEEFYKIIKKEVMPIYNIALNQGFGVMEELI